MLIVLVAAALGDSGPNDIVGARVVTCSSCRLSRLPEIQQFIRVRLPQYPALDVQYIHGHEPVIQFLNIYNELVIQHELAPMTSEEVERLVNRLGIRIDTPRPAYRTRPMVPTEHCIAWRQTMRCDPEGEREPLKDVNCVTVVEGGRSGYCECADGRRVLRTCDHRGILCDRACKAMIADRGEL